MTNTPNGLYYYKGRILPRGVIRMLEDNPTARLMDDEETRSLTDDVLRAYYKMD